MVFVAFALYDQSTEATWKIRAKSTHAPSQAWLLGSWVGDPVGPRGTQVMKMTALMRKSLPGLGRERLQCFQEL